MKLACIMFKYFPYGGLQRDFMRIAGIAIAEGDSIDVYTLEWSGDVPAGMNVNVIEVEPQRWLRIGNDADRRVLEIDAPTK